MKTMSCWARALARFLSAGNEALLRLCLPLAGVAEPSHRVALGKALKLFVTKWSH